MFLPCSWRLAKLFLQGGGRCIPLKESLLQAEALLKSCRSSVGRVLWGVLYPALRVPVHMNLPDTFSLADNG